MPIFGRKVAIFPWRYSVRSLPGPGAQNVAFLNEALPCQTPIGPGIANRRQFYFQTPATLAPHLIGIQGLGGLIHGQFYGTALIDVQNSG